MRLSDILITGGTTNRRDTRRYGVIGRRKTISRIELHYCWRPNASSWLCLALYWRRIGWCGGLVLSAGRDEGAKPKASEGAIDFNLRQDHPHLVRSDNTWSVRTRGTREDAGTR